MSRTLFILLCCSVTWSVEPVHVGIAAQFPGDRGIEKHKDVLFVEDFEAPDVATVTKRWTEVKN